MALNGSTILQLPASSGIGADAATVWLEIAQYDGFSWVSRKLTAEQLAAGISGGYVPTTTQVIAGEGLSGGGALVGNVTLSLDLFDLNATTSMDIDDTFGICKTGGSNLTEKVTFPNAMKAITGLTALGVPNPSNDYLIINRAADGDTYKINVSSLGLAIGNVPAGGTTGQPLIKLSATDYDSTWATLPVIGGGTGIIATTPYALLAGGATTTGALQQVASLGTAAQILTSNGPGALPTFQTASAALGQALTRTDDTNVTLTLGGAPTTALLTATSITAGWTGQLSLARGGSNANLTASNGGLVYSTASAMAILAGTATAGQIPRSGTSAAPSWSTATYPATAAAG